jgi:hypothetical protein
MRTRPFAILVIVACFIASVRFAVDAQIVQTQRPPLGVARPLPLPQVPGADKLLEYRRIKLPTMITKVDAVDGKCVEAGRAVRIHGIGFGTSAAGRTIRIIRRIELGSLRIAIWRDGLITAVIPDDVPARSYYEVVLADASGRWVTNLGRVAGCGAEITGGRGVVARIGTPFPRDNCRPINLDVLDVTYERVRAGDPGVFRLVDDRGTVASFTGWSSDQIATGFLYILSRWLTTVCYGPRMGNYNHRPTYRLMMWLDREGQLPPRSDFPAETSSCYQGCAGHTLNYQFSHCRIIPNLSTLDFGRVEAHVRDIRSGLERVPWTTVPVWGIRHPHVVGPRTFYSVDDWPLFTTEADVAWGKKFFARAATSVCSFGAFNNKYATDVGADEHDGMQFLVR